MPTNLGSSRITLDTSSHLKPILDGFRSNSGKWQISNLNSTGIVNTSKGMTAFYQMDRLLFLVHLFTTEFILTHDTMARADVNGLTGYFKCTTIFHLSSVRATFHIMSWSIIQLRVLLFKIPNWYLRVQTMWLVYCCVNQQFTPRIYRITLASIFF